MFIRKSLLILLLALLMLFPATGASAQTDTPPTPGTLTIYFFWGEGCPHCAEMEPFLDGLPARFPGVQIKKFETWNVPENQALFEDMAKAFNTEVQGVPTIFLSTYYNVGYSTDMNASIEAAVQNCLAQGCSEPAAEVLARHPDAVVETIGIGAPAVSAPSAPATEAPAASPPAVTPTEAAPTENPNPGTGLLSDKHEIKLPLLGTVDLDKQSLLISTLLISFVDGFNPCSLWVLSVLLALTLHTGSRKKVFIIGIVFITVTAAIYAIFIAGLFSVLKVVSFIGWIQVVVALVALFFGLVNMKDYFWYKEGLSFTIAEDKRGGIFQGIRKVMDASQSIWGLIGATIVLAAGVSLVEFSCTAGFPVLWTNLLNAQNVSFGVFFGLLILYMVIYQIDELVIFFTAVYSLRASRLEEKHGRILKLIGGTLMLTLAAVMLINPNLMNNLSSSLIIFGIAFALAGLILLLHRVILPKFGIWIGSEQTSKSPEKGSKKRK